MQLPGAGATPTDVKQADPRTSDIINKANHLADVAHSALGKISPESHDSSIYSGIEAFSARLVQELQNPISAAKFNDAALTKYEGRLDGYAAELKAQADLKAAQ